MFHCNYCYLTLKYFYSSFPSWRWIKINNIRILKCFYSTTGRKRWIKTLKNPDWICHNSCMTGLNGQRATVFTGKLFPSSAVSPKPADPTFMIQNRLSEMSVLKPAFKLDPGVWAETLRFFLPRFTDTSVTPGNHRAVDKHLGHSWFLKQVDTCWNIITMVTLKWCYWWRLSAVSFSWHQQASIDAAAQQEWFAISVHAWLMSPSLNRFRVNKKQIWHKCFITSHIKNIRIFMIVLKLHTSVRVRSSSAAALPGCSPSPGSPSGPAAPPLHTRLQNKRQVWAYAVTWPHRWSEAPLKHECDILLHSVCILSSLMSYFIWTFTDISPWWWKYVSSVMLLFWNIWI